MLKYRINWRSQITGNEGHGEPLFDSCEAAEAVVKTLEDRIPFLNHWIEAVEVEDEMEE